MCVNSLHHFRFSLHNLNFRSMLTQLLTVATINKSSNSLQGANVRTFSPLCRCRLDDDRLVNTRSNNFSISRDFTLAEFYFYLVSTKGKFFSSALKTVLSESVPLEMSAMWASRIVATSCSFSSFFRELFVEIFNLRIGVKMTSTEEKKFVFEQSSQVGNDNQRDI